MINMDDVEQAKLSQKSGVFPVVGQGPMGMGPALQLHLAPALRFRTRRYAIRFLVPQPQRPGLQRTQLSPRPRGTIGTNSAGYSLGISISR